MSVWCLYLARGDPTIGEAAIFHQDDRRLRLGRANLFHQRDAFRRHVGRPHVRQAVDHIDGGIDLRENVAHGLVHAAVAGEAEIDHRHVETASEDGRMHHAGAAGAGAVGDAGAVENDGLLPRGQSLELAAFGHADVQELDAVVERQIGGVFALARGQTFDDLRLHFLGGGLRDHDPLPFAVGIAGVKIDAADAGGRHVRHSRVASCSACNAR